MVSKTIPQTYEVFQDTPKEKPKSETDLLAVIESTELTLCLLRKMHELEILMAWQESEVREGSHE